MRSKSGLYLHTIARMKPSQVLGRLRAVRKADVSGFERTESRPFDISIPDLDFSADFRSRYDVGSLRHHEFLLLNERHVVDLSEWNVGEASHLWNFNLHYFEYCIPLICDAVERGDDDGLWVFEELVDSWIGTCRYPRGDAWHPYTISLRLVNWLICLGLLEGRVSLGSAFLSRMRQSMYLQYRHLLENQETHLLANHYFENLKTLCIMALYFGEMEVFDMVFRDFEREIGIQILSDGVHYERSMMYHKLALEGLLRVVLACRNADVVISDFLTAAVKRMLDAMVSIERGMGKTPFFNDAADCVAKSAADLSEACASVMGLVPDGSLLRFDESGFFKLYADDVAVLVFAGAPGPSCMLGHAHCDVLSYELSVAGEPVVVNSGTYAYQSSMRSYFRSTLAHNAAMVNGHEQMECWGEHRVARGISELSISEVSEGRISASFRNYSGERLAREIRVSNSGLEVTDRVCGINCPLESAVHFAPGFSLRPDGCDVRVSQGDFDVGSVLPEVADGFTVEQFPYSPEFGKLCTSDALHMRSSRGEMKYSIVLKSDWKEDVQ